MTRYQPRFIIVDDDPINNMLCKKAITTTIPHTDVTTFTEPETALAYLKSAYAKTDSGKAILLLDINMPTMTGWQFMEQFKREGTTIKGNIFVYILSSSVDPVDKEKANLNRDIIDYIQKPLNKATLLKMFG